MDYKAAYDLVLQIQQQLQTEVLAEAEQELQQKDYLRRLDYKRIKVLAATYELQEFLAGYCHEDLEEEIFRDMMQEVAAEEGRRAIEENERLKNDPNFVVPESLRKRAMNLINDQ